MCRFKSINSHLLNTIQCDHNNSSEIPGFFQDYNQDYPGISRAGGHHGVFLGHKPSHADSIDI